MSYNIHIQDLVVDAWVGIHPHEQCYQSITVNIDLTVNFDIEDIYDSIEHTVDYETIVNQIKTSLSKKKYQLLETLASDIADLILIKTQVKSITVTASKPQILNSQRISISVTKQKDKQ